MSKLYDDASLMMIPSSVKDGKLYSVLPQPKPLSGDLVTNGGFDSTDDWGNLGANVTISNGTANFTSAANGERCQQYGVGFVNGNLYKIELEVSNYTSGTLGIFMGGAYATQNITTNGKHTFYHTPVSGDEFFLRSMTTGSTFSVDNVSIVEVDQAAADFTFSRGSNLAATRINKQGLIEKGRENLLLQSNQFDTTWDTPNSTVTSGQTGYDGTNDAWLLNADSTGTSRYVRQLLSASGVVTFSFYAKAGTTNYVRVQVSSSTNGIAYFDLVNGTVGFKTSLITQNIESVGNGWFRCSIVTDKTITDARIYVAQDDTATVNEGDNIYIQDAQLEVGLVATDYIESGATTGKAGVLEDLPRLNWGGNCPSLLLEPSRQNLITKSEHINGITGISKIGSSIDTNVTTSPEGLLNASLLKEDSSNGSHFFYKDFNLTNGSTYTISMFVKSNGENRNFRFGDGGLGWSSGFNSNFDLTNETATDGTIENYGNGWYRCSVTGTTNATTSRLIVYSILNDTTTYQGDGSSGVYLYGFQIEEGSYPTSYIPTHGTSVTRATEDGSYVLIDNIITSSSFTLFVNLDDWVGSDANTYIIYLRNDGDTRIQIRVRSDGYRVYYQSLNGGSLYPIAGDKFANKFCISYDGQKYRLFKDGVKENTTTSINDTNWTYLGIGGVYASCPTKEITLFPTALSDNECINLTTI